MAMKKIIINRKRWGKASLRRSDNDKRCCLGFACISYGVPAKHLVGVGYPSSLPGLLQKKLPKWLRTVDIGSNTKDVKRATIINDDDSLTMDQKEKLLKPIFRKHNIRLVFQGQP